MQDNEKNSTKEAVMSSSTSRSFFSTLTMVFLYSCVLSFTFAGVSIAAAAGEGELLPDISLTVPENQSHIDYLGLKGKPGTPFKVSDIDADILLIELFSMYCPYCQQAAPTVNELYEKLEETKRADLKIVLIGIGANNTDLEVDTFRQGFDIAFPLFSDKDMSLYKSLGEGGTPTFIGYRKDGERRIVFLRKSGGIKDPHEFFENIMKGSGLK